MSVDTCRSIGAIAGLLLGLVFMVALGSIGIIGGDFMIPGALLGAGGAVAGGISGEKFHAWRQRGG